MCRMLEMTEMACRMCELWEKAGKTACVKQKNIGQMINTRINQALINGVGLV